MILVLAGAGASAAISPELYPTTVEFFDRIPDDVKDTAWFIYACQFLSDRQGGLPFDIEKILGVLSEMRDYCLKSHQESTFPGWMLAENRFASLANARTELPDLAVPHLGDFVREMENEHARVEELQGDIHSLVYQYYEPLPPSEALASWMTLIETLIRPYRSLEIFTTNYDRVLEEVILESNHTYLTVPDAKELATGNRYDRRHPWLDLSCWDPRRESRDGVRVRLTKLHGSVDWQRNSAGRIIISNPVYTRNDRNHILLYPGYKGAPNSEPFITFHNHLRSVAQQADAAIFIGYAFRDEHINGILANLPPNVPKYLINKEKPPDLPAILEDAVHFDYGFTDQSVAECIDSLRGHDLISQ